MDIRKSFYMGSVSRVTMVNMVLAVVALFKDMILASYLGTSANADALLVAFFITDMIGNNLIANAIGTSSVPEFSRVYTKGKDELYKSAIDLSIVTFVATIIIAISMYIFKFAIVLFLGNGFSESTRIICIQLIYILIPTMIIYPIVYVGISVMQVLEKYVISALSPVVFNIVFLIGVSACYFLEIPIDRGIYLIAIFILISVVAMVIFMLVSINKDKEFKIVVSKYRFKISRFKSTKNVFKLFLIYIIVLILPQITMYIERYFASQFEAGSVAALNYAYRLSQFPIWVFVSAIGTVLFPMIAKAKNENSQEDKKILYMGIWMTLILVMPISILIYILRVPIISTLFLRGAFDSNSLKITTELLSGYTIAIVGQSVTAICLKYLLASKSIKTITSVFLISNIINITLDIYFVKHIGLEGLGYGAAIGASINAIILLYSLRIKTNSGNGNYLKLSKLIIANIIIAFIGNSFKYIWNNFISGIGILYNISYIGMVFIISAGVYYITIKYMKLIELRGEEIERSINNNTSV